MVQALAGLLLVWLGGFKLFEWVMRGCIALMFVVVMVTAARLWPGTIEVMGGLWPRLPAGRDGLSWTLALIGGVGGTLTVLCYGYWIRAAGRVGVEALPATRIDLALGYAPCPICLPISAACWESWRWRRRRLIAASPIASI